MSRQISDKEITEILLSGALGLGVGYLAGHAVLGLCVVLIWLLYRQLQQLARLRHWLLDTEQDVPESEGAWDEVFRGIYYLRRNERRARDSLLSIIDRARASVSALEEAVALVDSDGNLEWWNPAAEALLGFRAVDRGQPVINLIRTPSFIRYFKHGPYDEGLKVSSQRHSGRQLQFEITQFGDNDRLMIVYDITRLHNLEQMRKDFVANVSHELRTPLTVLSGYLETLQDQHEGIEPRWLRALGQMAQQATRMNNLVNDLLLLSRLENQPEDREPHIVHVPRMLKQIHQDAVALATPKQQTVTLECEPGLCVLGMEADLRSAFSNLVTNAVKYTPNGGVVAVRWLADGQGAHFSVTDNGLGIDEVHLPRLTERFYRADAARSSATGGTGLGLAIVKHVLMQHKATLDIQSELGRGSRFTCSFMPTLIERET
ncbi:PAS/PAC sensor signal transduction histidine kinase [Paraperlucidibaca baekdonensis]|uniref:Phosphate regulon sensor protein PhoR n=1 Tax=Paraperlucidibaca baekdonensis TaxID=748120 RepID=A0A3E0H8X5_9GAMM|nr:phosphate regulon sensor histidine kinase PhoR [Paraperlucidibaca baekdonensis]REH40147.1 PAS/PAC sensor signal transduction histidine kinase [Paraperlucidibaca baekdonensis]